MFGRLTNRPLCLLLATNTACLAYFYLVDRTVFSSTDFAPIFRLLLLHYDFQTAWLALFVCGLAATWRRSDAVLAIVDFLGRHPGAAAAACMIAFSGGALVVYHNHPFSMDEYAAVFQSRLFAAGRLYAKLPPSALDWLIVRGFNGEFLDASRQTGEAVEAYWPGFALLLAPFQFFGVPWACNALLAAASVYLIFLITREITNDQRAAGWAILFTVASGAFVAYAISYYSMQAHLTLNLLFAFLMLRPTATRALIAGLAGSWALNLHNPFPHALFATPWLASMAMDRRHRAFLAPLVLGYLPGLCLLAAWFVLRGHFLPDTAGPASAVPTGVFAWPDLALLNLRVASLVKLWLWATPCLLLFAISGARRGFDDRGVRLLALSACFTFLGYCFVRFDQGHGWGYRYFQSAGGCLPILAAIALAREKPAGSQLIAFAGAAAVLSAALIVPLQLLQVEDVIAAHLAQLPSPMRPGRNVFFVKPLAGFQLADRIQIDPLLRDEDLFLVTRGEPLDLQLIHQNWPTALELASGSWGQQWYVPPSKRPDPDGEDLPFSRLHFESRGAVSDPRAGAWPTGRPTVWRESGEPHVP